MESTLYEIVGRDREREEAHALLKGTRAQSVAAVLRFVGPSGIGKTAVAQSVVEWARADGWATAMAVSHRIQAALPYVVARRTIATLVDALGEDAYRYTSGLEAGILAAKTSGQDGRVVEDTLLRLAEAVLLDRPLLIVIDDIQWADSESRNLFERVLQVLADRPFVFGCTERSDETSSQSRRFDGTDIYVAELDKDATAMLARSLLPTASNEVIEAIADHARGRAIDVVSLSQTIPDPSTISLADVTASLRARIAREVALLDPATRDFLQTCSLISDPISYDVLKMLWPDEHALMSLIERSSGRFLIQSDDGLRFVHAAVAQSIAETIAIEIPLRKRIIEALLRLPDPRLEDRDRLVEQAAATGDRAQEKALVQALVADAEKQHAFQVAARGIERLISLTPFEPRQSLPLYERLSILNNALTRDRETHRVCSEALGFALASNVRGGLGGLVLSDLFSLFMQGERELFDRTLQRFDTYLTEPEDRSSLLPAKLLAAMADYDASAFEAARKEYEEAPKSDLLDVRFATFESLRFAYLGDIAGCESSLARARVIAQRSGPALLGMIDAAEAFAVFQSFGPGHGRTSNAINALSRNRDTHPSLSALVALHRGDARDAISQVVEALVHFDGIHPRRLLAGVAATASALTAIPLPGSLQQELERDAALMQDSPSSWLLPMASYSAATLASSDPKRAQLRLRQSIDALSQRPVLPMILSFSPVVLAIAANRINDRESLDAIANRALQHNAFPLNVAQYDLARAYAQRALGRKPDDVNALVEAFNSLGSPCFSAIASDLAGSASVAEKVVENELTRREREVASLIAKGNTNREIAQELVLSERTVEAHIANIFGKLSANTRAQVAVWYTRTFPAHA